MRDYDAPRPDSLRLNQVQLTLDRPYDNTKSFDFGARFDLLYGGDAKLTHAAGLDDHIGGMGNDDFQWADLLQAYGQLWFKTGKESGLEITFGKFLELAGSESAEATNNLLYSHSDIYTFLEPTTHTGGMAKYIFNSQFFAYFGVVEGWDVVEDNNTADDLHRRRRLVEPGTGRGPRADAGAAQPHHRPGADRRQQRLSNADGRRDQPELDREADRIAEFRLAGRGERPGHRITSGPTPTARRTT